ncbi:MAG: ThiF family adenylyltransferase [bacterium]|nr:ThiF family adenylyltransferase [bacterium]
MAATRRWSRVRELARRADRQHESPALGPSVRPTDTHLAGGHPRVRVVGPSDGRRDAVRIAEPAYTEAIASLGGLPAEAGGPLGGDHRTGIVSEFYLDESARRDEHSYSPDVETLNRLFRTQWNPRGLSLLGFAHSHPPGVPVPSTGDRRYARRLLAALPSLDRLQLPIVEQSRVGNHIARGFAVVDDGSSLPAAQRVSLDTVPDCPTRREPDPATFLRASTSYELAIMANTRVVLVGVGGAAQHAEHLARCGIGELVLVDPDRVEPPNVATQQAYLRDAGRSKVGALAERLTDISPILRVAAVPHSVQQLDLPTLRMLLHRPLFPGEPIAPRLTVTCGFTDDFWTQAEVARIALQEGTPLLAGQVYEQGCGAEIVFVAPGHTAACHRCVLGSRYYSYLAGFRNDVTSAGAPLFATERLNATKAIVMMAMVHGLHPDADRGHPATARFSTLFETIRERNLIQIRLTPDFESILGVSVFERTLTGADSTRVVCDETLWHPQTPTAHPPCPDCGGTGDLAQLAGTNIAPLTRPENTERTP